LHNIADNLAMVVIYIANCYLILSNVKAEHIRSVGRCVRGCTYSDSSPTVSESN